MLLAIYAVNVYRTSYILHPRVLEREITLTISVIIASYKRVPSLRKCIKSLEKQDRKPNEVIIALQSVDEESIEFVKDNIGEYNIKLKMVTTNKKGKIFQENAALRQTNGNIVCFIDDDAIAHPDWLKLIEQWYIKDEEIGGVGGQDIVHQPDETIDEKPVNVVGKITWFGRSIGNHHNVIKFVQYVDFLKGCNMSYRKKLLTQINEILLGLTVPFEEEWIGLSIRQLGYKVVYDPSIKVDHFPPTPRKDYQDLRQWNTITAFIRGHNHVYTLLYYFSLPRKLIFLFYTLFIGDFQNPGPGRLLISFFKKDFNRIRGFANSSFRGKINGLFTYHNHIWRESNNNL